AADALAAGALAAGALATRSLEPQQAQRAAHRFHGALEHRPLILGELDLNNLLDAARAQDDGHADVEVLRAALAVEVGDVRDDALLVLENGLHHLHNGRAGGVVGAAGLEEAHDLAAALAGALHDAVDGLLGQQLFNGDAARVGVADQGHHLVAVAAHDEGRDVLHRDAQLHGEEGAEASGVQHAGHAHDPVGGQPADLPGRVGHHVHRVGDDDVEGVGGVLDALLHDAPDDIEVGLEQVVAGHAGLAGHAGRDDDHVGVGRLLVAVGADDADVEALDGARFQQVQGLALRHALHDVHQYDVAQLFCGRPVGSSGPDVACADNGDLRPWPARQGESLREMLCGDDGPAKAGTHASVALVKDRWQYSVQGIHCYGYCLGRLSRRPFRRP